MEKKNVVAYAYRYGVDPVWFSYDFHPGHSHRPIYLYAVLENIRVGTGLKPAPTLLYSLDFEVLNFT